MVIQFSTTKQFNRLDIETDMMNLVETSFERMYTTKSNAMTMDSRNRVGAWVPVWFMR